MSAILSRLRNTLAGLVTRVLSVGLVNTRNIGIVDLRVNGGVIHGLTDSSSVVVDSLEENDLDRIFRAHTNCDVRTITIRSHPHLTTLPASLGKFRNVQCLDLSYNGINDLPWSIVYLKKLKVLNLSHNKFTSVPPIIGHLVTLEALLLNNNELRYLPTALIHLHLLKVLDVSGNEDLKSLPPCTHQDPAALKDFLKKRFGRTNLWENSRRRYTENGIDIGEDADEVKSLLELCVAAILQFEVDYFLQMPLPPPLKRYLYEKDAARIEKIKLAKCSRCLGYFSSQMDFDGHDCPR